MLDPAKPILKPYRHSSRSDVTAQELVDKILGDNGIYTKLEKRWKAYQDHQDWHAHALTSNPRRKTPTFIDEDGRTRPASEALSPSPSVNANLSELVEYCTAAYQEGVVAEFFDIANSNDTYRKRLSQLPALTGSAEGEMEKYYARQALERITVRDNGNGHIALSDEAVQSIKERAEIRLADYLNANGTRFHLKKANNMMLIVPDNANDKELVAQIRRILRLDETIQPFPYTHNYEHIAYGEKHLLSDPHVHKNFPLDMLREQQQSMIEGLPPEEAKAVMDQHPETFGITHLEEKYMTFVGSGALPLTGLMNHIISGCKINLVDRDPEAVDISRKFVTYLELLGVLEKDAVKVYTSEGADIHYGGPSRDLERGQYAGEARYNAPHVELQADGRLNKTTKNKIYVPTDILYIAGLIPNKDKQTMMLNLENNDQDPVRNIMVRSARGLSRMLYEPVKNEAFEQNSYYASHGTLVPERHLLPYTKPLEAYKEDSATPATVSAILSDDNINTAILLHRNDLPMINPNIMFEEGSKFAQQLEKDLGHKPDFSHIEREKIRRSLQNEQSATPKSL